MAVDDLGECDRLRAVGTECRSPLAGDNCRMDAGSVPVEGTGISAQRSSLCRE